MSIYLGNTEIGQIYLGDTEIGQIYLGSNLVFDGGGEPLPYDAQIEYLQSSGTQYIDTGIYGANDLDFEISFKGSNRDNFYGVMGDRYSSSSRRYTVITSTNSYTNVGSYITVGTNSNQVTSSGTYLSNVKHAYKKVGTTIYADDHNIGSLGTISSFTTPNTIILFGMRDNGTLANMLYGYIYYCKLSKNGTLLRDFIPVRVGTTGYMYDKVSGQLFGNDGTGDFILGNDITI